MGEFDAKYAAYERSMQQNNYFGLKGQAISDQLGRYSLGLEHDAKKAANLEFGRAFARELAMERQAGALTATENAALQSGLTGNTVPTPVQTVTDTLKDNTKDEVKIAKKMKVGTGKKGFKYYLIDNEGKTYLVDKQVYNGAKEGKMFKLNGTKPLENTANLADKVKKEIDKIKKQFKKPMTATHNYSIITDPQLYKKEQADMHEKLWGNFSYPSNTPLGTAKPKPTGEPMTSQKYDQQHGRTPKKQEVSGVLESERRAAATIKGNETKRHIEEILSKPTEYSPENLDLWTGHGPNPTQDAMREYYTNLEKEPTLHNVMDKLDNIEQGIKQNSDKMDDVAQAVKQNSDKLDDVAKAVKQNSDKLDDLTKQFAKANKRIAAMGVIATIAAGVTGYVLGRSSNKDDTTKQNDNSTTANPATPSSQTASSQAAKNTNQAENDTTQVVVTQPITAQVNPAAQDSARVAASAENTAATSAKDVQTKTQENENTFLDKNGEYQTKKGDTFWSIAKKYLEYKYKTEPDKFANLPKAEQDVIIQKECERIMKDNGYWYDENHNLPVPMLHKNLKIKMADKIALAA